VRTKCRRTVDAASSKGRFLLDYGVKDGPGGGRRLAVPEGMSSAAKAEEDGIYRVDTIPPPEGEDDAYSAPTRVGPMAAAAVEKMMADAERHAATPRPPPSGVRPVLRKIAVPAAVDVPVDIEMTDSSLEATLPKNLIPSALRTSALAAEAPKMFEDGDDGDTLDPTVLGEVRQSGSTARLEVAQMPEVVAALDRHDAAPPAQPIAPRAYFTFETPPSPLLSTTPTSTSRLSRRELAVFVVMAALLVALPAYYWLVAL
jgi:hypothetical protein